MKRARAQERIERISLFLADTPFSIAVWFALKATAILAAAALLQALWQRRTSAATRHLTWTLVVASLLLLPIAWRAAPRWSVVTAAPAPVDVSVAAVNPAMNPGIGPASVAAATARDMAPLAPAAPESALAGACSSPPGPWHSASTSWASSACCCRSCSITVARGVWQRGRPP